MTVSGRPPVIPALRMVDAVRLEKERELVGTFHSANPLDPYYIELHCTAMPLKRFAELVPTEGMEVTLGGMVVDFATRPSKKGGNFGIMHVQDYTSTHEFMLFGNDFINFHNYGVPGTPLIIKGVFERRFANSDVRFRITSMELLSKVKGTLVKGITISLPAQTIPPALCDILAEHLKSTDEALGSLSFEVIDTESNRSMRLDSPSHVPINKDLIDKLEDLGVEYELEPA